MKNTEPFSSLQTCWTPATRVSRYGRASSGKVLCLGSKAVKCAKIVSLMGWDIVKVETSQTFFIIPVYLSCHEWHVSFKELVAITENINENMMLIGDFNCRTSNGNEIPTFCLSNIIVNRTRKSKDKIINCNGKAFLNFLCEKNLIILNGRAGEDDEGEFTFVGGNGVSVIDYCCVSTSLIRSLRDFKVLEATFSDHMPLFVSVSLQDIGSDLDKGVKPILPKLIWKPNLTEKYQETLTNLVCSTVLEDSDNAVQIIGLIKEASRSLNNPYPSKRSYFSNRPWFSKECFKLRKASFKNLRKFRKTNLYEDKCQYIESNKNYKKLCKIAKEAYLTDKYKELTTIRDSKKFWTFVNGFKKRTARTFSMIEPNEWINYFKNLYNPPITSVRLVFVEPKIENEFLDTLFSLKELEAVLQKCKNNKAPGIDRTPYEFFKYSPVTFQKMLLQFYNDLYQSGKMVTSFKETIIFPLYKKGSIKEVSSYRGISLLNTISKIYSGLILNRLTKWAEDGILKEFQAGFRRDYSTIDQIFSLTNIAKLRLSKKRQKLYCFFIDFSSAFDTVDRYSLWVKLHSLGLSYKMVNAIRSLLTGTTGSVLNKNGLTDAFDIEMGVQQGSLLSPLLFSLYINDISEAITGGGVIVGNTKIKMLAYADDLVLMASDPPSLQFMINDICNYTEKWNLRINLNKSKILIFSNGGRRSKREKWYLRNKEIEIVNSYKYLGVLLTPSLSFGNMFKEKIGLAKYGLNEIWAPFIYNPKIDFSSKLKVFDSCIKSIVFYGAQVWGSSHYDELEKFQQYFIKRLFKLPSFTPKCFILKEIDVNPIFLSTLKMNQNYLIRVFNLPDHRVCKITALEVKRNELFWYKDLKEITASLDMNLQDLMNTAEWPDFFDLIREKLTAKNRANLEENIMKSRYNLYKVLDYNQSYFKSPQLSLEDISLIMKIRANVVDYKLSPLNDEHFCPMCTEEVIDSWFHFLATCPCLSSIRLEFLGGRELEPIQLKYFLNGKDWKGMLKFVRYAYQFWSNI